MSIQTYQLGRDLTHKVVRDQTHRNTTLRLFWISLYFER